MDNPILREKAQYIEPSEIHNKKIQNLISEMHKSLATQNDGVALAAPQIAESYQVFVVAPFIFEQPDQEHLVYINPEIISHSEKTKHMHEGCLSCRWKVGDVNRSLKTTVRAYDEQGNQFEQSADGLLAHIHQHEIDHLHGILFLDKAENLRDMTQSEIDEVLNNK